MFGRKKVVFLAALILTVALYVQPAAMASPTPPVATFTQTPPAPIFRQIIFFNASASYDPDGGGISSYRWDFDDGTIYTIIDPSTYHNYTAFGTYNVTLMVTDDEAETDTTWQIVTVRQYPVAFFTYSPSYPIVGETVTFNASFSTPNGGTIVSYEWDFGDVTSANVTNPTTTHNYAVVGTYNVTLAVRDSEELTDTTWKLITVRNYPVASFIHTPDRPLVNENVMFDASSSTPDGGTITSYFWDFGDNINGTDAIVIHAYAAVGNYNVTLTVTDSENLTNTAWNILEVVQLPVAFFTYSPAAPLKSETVTFNASFSTPNGGTIVSYEWDFDDGSSPVTEADPITTHEYTTFGNYEVTLTVTDSEDLTDTYSDTIRVLVHPVATFTYSPATPIINETVTFDASTSYDSDRDIVNYAWDFDDGSPILNKPNPVTTHNYTAEGTYNVTLTVTDDDGLTDIAWKLITIYTFLYVHDVAITNLTVSETEVYVGTIVNITVVAKNEGTAPETFTVTVHYDTTSVGTKTVTYLLPGLETTLTFSWDHASVTPGIYTVSVKASEVPGETDTADNIITNGTIEIKMVGDVNGDGQIDIVDIVIVALAFGSAAEDNPETPWDETEKWNSQADFNYDGVVDIVDIVIAAIHFGEKV